MTIYQPYTYLIGWSKLDRWYYGVRFARNCNPNELWVKYFTSSKFVHEFRKINGEPDVIQVRKVFSCIVEAQIWENKVLHRLNVVDSSKWLNRGIISSKLIVKDLKKGKEHREAIAAAKTGSKLTEEHRANMSKGRKGIKANWDPDKKKAGDAAGRLKQMGKKLSEDHKNKTSEGLKRYFAENPEACKAISDKAKGKIVSNEVKAKMSASHLGKPKSAETRAKMSAAARLSYEARKQKKIKEQLEKNLDGLELQ